MFYNSEKNFEIYQNKNRLFSQYNLTNPDVIDELINPLTISSIKKTNNYLFLLKHQSQIQLEFETIFAALKHQKRDANNKKYWLYCYYLASLMEAFYLGYHNKTEAEKYAKLKAHIKDIANNVTLNANNKSFLKAVKDDLLEGIKNICTSPLHFSKMRDYIGQLNMWRIYLLFVKLSMKASFENDTIKGLINSFDSKVYVDQVKDVFVHTQDVFDFLSVGIFGARFLIDSFTLLKHTFLPTEQEKSDNTTRTDRFKHEYLKRRGNGYNDIAWGPVNALCNYGLFGISDALGNQITAAFLVFDVLMTAWKLNIAHDKYLKAKAGILQQRQELENKLERAIQTHNNQLQSFRTRLASIQLEKAKLPNTIADATLSIDQVPQVELHRRNLTDLESEESLVQTEITTCENNFLIHIQEIQQDLKMLTAQSTKLDTDWRTKKQTFLFVMAAASLLALGWTASMLTSPLGCFLICAFGVAMYRSANSFSNYREKSLTLSELQQTTAASPEERVIAKKENTLAWIDFAYTLTRNTFVPALLVSSFSIFPPATLALALLFIVAQVTYSYFQHQVKNEMKSLEVNLSNSLAMS